MVMVASQIVESNTHAEKMDLGKKKPLRFDNVMIASSQLQESKCGKKKILTIAALIITIVAVLVP